MDIFRAEMVFAGGLEMVRAFGMASRDLVVRVWPEKDKLADDLELCMIEGLSNVFFHAHNRDASKAIRFEIIGREKQLIVRIYDSGSGFVYRRERVELPDFQSENGRGLYIISQLMDSVSYHTRADLNYLEMIKNL
jgi:serine/threonine-protein kinase RsbW